MSTSPNGGSTIVTARMAFVLVDGAFTEDLLGRLDSKVLDGLLHDPMHPEVP